MARPAQRHDGGRKQVARRTRPMAAVQCRFHAATRLHLTGRSRLSQRSLPVNVDDADLADLHLPGDKPLRAIGRTHASTSVPIAFLHHGLDHFGTSCDGSVEGGIGIVEIDV
jgi:hypothetical protein